MSASSPATDGPTGRALGSGPGRPAWQEGAPAPTGVVAGALAGAVAGAVATLPMSAAMLLAGRAGLMGRQPPQRITDRGLAAVGARPPRPARRVLAVLAHVGFGAAAGVPFVLLDRARAGLARASGLPPGAVGATYGLAVWASAYLGWVPAAGLMPPAHRDRPGRPASMVAAHLVWGWALATVAPRITTRLAVRVPWAPTRGAGLRPGPGAPRA